MLRMNRLLLQGVKTTSSRLLSHPPTPKISKKNFSNSLYGFAYLMGGAGLGYHIYQNNIKTPIVLPSQLNKKGEMPDGVIFKNKFEEAGSETLSGHSGGQKIKLTNDETGKTEYYYHKETYHYHTYLKELFIGSMGRLLLGEYMPKVFAVEWRKANGESVFSFASQSLGHQYKSYVSNLESWMLILRKDEEEGLTLNPFKHDSSATNLGVIIAFNALFGKSDEKLSNIAFSLNLNGDAFFYSIDNESALVDGAHFISDAKTALRCIGEYSKKTLNERITEDQCEGLDVDDDPRFQLKNNKEILEWVRPMLHTAIEEDLKKGLVHDMYQKFVSLPEEKIAAIFDQFGTIFSDHEKHEIMSDMLARQKCTRDFLLGHDSGQDMRMTLQRLNI